MQGRASSSTWVLLPGTLLNVEVTTITTATPFLNPILEFILKYKNGNVHIEFDELHAKDAVHL
jgi:hypothetical protein